tara:strand:- start:4731 stop:5387 length:657 start_codon:yes stop_codon:yes gene_type:complete
MNNQTHNKTKIWFENQAEDYIKQKYRYTGIRRIQVLQKYIFGKVLELGSSEKLTPLLHKNSKSSIILDISFNILKKTTITKNSFLINGDGTKLPFKSNSFDTIICSETIYYFDKPIEFIKEAKRVLKKNGTLLVVNLNPFWFFTMSIWVLLGLVNKDDCNYVKNKIPYAKKVKKWMRKEKFKNIDIKGFCVIPLKHFEILDKTPLQMFGFIKLIKGRK